MTPEENKELVRRYFDERWNKQNIAVIDELLPPEDAESAKDYFRYLHATFADIDLTIRDLVADGPLVAVHWAYTGTHQAEHLGVAPTGRRVEVQGMALITVADGRIVEDVAYWNDMELLSQLEAA